MNCIKIKFSLNAWCSGSLLIPNLKDKITRRRAADSTSSTARRANAVRLFFRFGMMILWLAVALPAQAFDIQRWTSSGGAKVLLVERHDNPIVDIDITFDAGSRRDAPDKIGVADMANGLLDTGTAQDDEEALRVKISDLAVTISSYGELERGGVRIRSLSRADTLNAAAAIANQMLVSPRYDDKVLQREKSRAIAGLRQSLTQPGFLAGRALDTLNYPQHPYGYGARENEASLAAISRADLQRFHAAHYAANNAVIAIVGDLTRAQAQQLAERLLQGLPESAAPLAAVPPVALNKNSRNQRIAHPASQAHIMLGLPVITRDDPDYYALLTGNYILGGGGFDSRLMKVLRDQKGYTYGASSSLSPLQQAGPLTIGFATKKASAEAALADARQVVADFVAQGPTEAELAQAKANIVGGFPLRFDSNAKLIGYLSVMGFYNLPNDFLDAYPAKVEALTTSQIRAAWQRRLNPAQLNTVVVGGNGGE